MEGGIAFIGLGAIGYPMAANIRRKTPKTTVLHIFDVYRPACERFTHEFSSLGPIEIVDTPRQAAASAGVVISMVPGSNEVKNVYLDSVDGIIAAPKAANRLLIESSTIDTETARHVAEVVRDAGRGLYVDAPVSGGVPAAEGGSLSFMIGHTPPDEGGASVEILGQTLAMMGDPAKFFWCGSIGTGLAAKISNNYISCSVLLLVAEAMAIGTRSGVDPALLHRIIHNSTGQTFMGDNVCPVPGVVPHAPSSNNWRLGFKTQMFIKDITLGIEAARAARIHPTMAEAALGVFEKASTDPRCIDKDGSSVYLHITDTKQP
ncbi:hypothetical protein AK830_g6435 [Neonectria ditissima]|uniref:3-hydroxyisobutyrate dehydrogenase n=1 Tax=Neonectria ditissima TaxID=78410 RepID=A0A0P7AQM7_9HYPO|nr:hypothetical protein AK830_g6435 [Neonectria ditissima]